MWRVTEPGKVAGWIAAPEIGINNAPLDYEYVGLNCEGCLPSHSLIQINLKISGVGSSCP